MAGRFKRRRRQHLARARNRLEPPTGPARHAPSPQPSQLVRPAAWRADPAVRRALSRRRPGQRQRRRSTSARVMLDCHPPSARPVSTCGSRSPEITCLSGRRGDATRSASESWQRSAAGPGTLCGRSDANAAQSAKVRRHYLGGDDRTIAGRHARGLCSRVALPDAPVTLGQRHSRLGAHRLGSCDITLTSAGLSTWPGRLAAPLPVTGRDSARCLQCPLLGEADGDLRRPE
jgi:hypothetical protein